MFEVAALVSILSLSPFGTLKNEEQDKNVNDQKALLYVAFVWLGGYIICCFSFRNIPWHSIGRVW